MRTRPLRIFLVVRVHRCAGRRCTDALLEEAGREGGDGEEGTATFPSPPPMPNLNRHYTATADDCDDGEEASRVGLQIFKASDIL